MAGFSGVYILDQTYNLMIEKFVWMIFAHALGDMALQTEFMGKYKSKLYPFHSNGREFPHFWVFVLSSHALTCGAVVAIITGLWWLGVLEAIFHWIIDYMSTNRRITFWQDQTLHLFSKIVWVILWV